VNVLFVTGAIPYAGATSGAAVVLAGELSALASRHRVTLVTFPPESRAEQAALEAWRGSGVIVEAGHTAAPLPIVSAKRTAERWWATRGNGPTRVEPVTGDERTQAVIDRVLAKGDIDVVQAESIGVGVYHYPDGVPRVVTEHEVARFDGVSNAWRDRQPKIWRGFDRVQVFTDADAGRIASVAPDLADRVRVNPFGIDLPAPLDPADVDANAVTFIGGFRHAPNVDAALWLVNEILPLLHRRTPHAHIWLVGAHPPPEVRRLAGAHVTVTGQVPDVRPHLARAAVVAAPVRLGGGMRRKVLDALAHGCAVVTTSRGADGLAGSSSTQPLRIADAADAFAEQIADLLGDQTRRRELGVGARAFVAAHHSWSGFADRLDRVYREVCR